MGNEKKQTAVSWLEDKLFDRPIRPLFVSISVIELGQLLNQAKQLEREQMIKFADDYSYTCTRVDGEDEFWMTLTAEEYYEEKNGTTN